MANRRLQLPRTINPPVQRTSANNAAQQARHGLTQLTVRSAQPPALSTHATHALQPSWPSGDTPTRAPTPAANWGHRQATLAAVGRNLLPNFPTLDLPHDRRCTFGVTCGSVRVCNAGLYSPTVYAEGTCSWRRKCACVEVWSCVQHALPVPAPVSVPDRRLPAAAPHVTYHDRRVRRHRTVHHLAAPDGGVVPWPRIGVRLHH